MAKSTPKSTKAELKYAKDYYNNNKAKVLARQKAHRDSKKAPPDPVAEAKAALNKGYYQNNKAKYLANQKEYRAGIKTKKAENIKNGLPVNTGIPASKTSKHQNKYRKKYDDAHYAQTKAAAKKKAEAKIIERQRKADWWRKKRAKAAQKKLDAYNKEFGYE